MSAGITEAQREALAQLAPVLAGTTYLAGGVAIALEHRHRQSIDLDLFAAQDFDPERLGEQLATAVPSLRVVGRAAGTLHAEVVGVPVSILTYRYPLIAELRTSMGVPVAVASRDDLACMKVAAIAGRGAAKDFWDLDELLQGGVAGGDLAALMELYARKFTAEDIGHAIRALAYFGDADAAPLPRGLTHDAWRAIKQAFARRVVAL